MGLPSHVEVDGHRVHLQQALDLMVDVLEGRAVLVHPDPDNDRVCSVTFRANGDPVRVVRQRRSWGQLWGLAQYAFGTWGRHSRRKP